MSQQSRERRHADAGHDVNMTDQEEDVANVFAVPDLWRTSTWVDQLPRDDAGSFFSTNIGRKSRAMVAVTEWKS